MSRLNLYGKVVIILYLMIFLVNMNNISGFLKELSLIQVTEAAVIVNPYEDEEDIYSIIDPYTEDIFKNINDIVNPYEDEEDIYSIIDPYTEDIFEDIFAGSNFGSFVNQQVVNHYIAPKFQNYLPPKSDEQTLLLDIASNVGFDPDKIVKAYQEMQIEFPNATLPEFAGYSLDEDKIVGMPTEHTEALYDILLSQQSSPEKAREVEANIGRQTTQQIAVSPVIHNTVNHLINNRLDLLRPVIGGIAGGDGDRKIVKGFWLRGLLGSSEYDGQGATAGYVGNMAGGTVGGDFEIMDNLLFGLAYSNVNSKFKYHDARKGDVTKAGSHVWALYSQGRICNTFLLQGIASYAHSNIKTYNLRRDFNRKVSAKFKGDSYNLEGILHYLKFNPANANIQILPYIGLRYTYYKEGAYKERGARVLDVAVENARSNNIFTGLFGVKFTGQKQLAPTTYIVPTFYAGIELYSGNKSPKVKARFAYLDKRLENTGQMKQPRIGYDLGVGLLYRYRNLELFADYNCLLQRRYVSHQGALSLKVLF